MKKVIISILAVSALFSFISCNKNSRKSNEPITLVMAEVNPPDTIVGKMDQAFKQKVEELSDGKIKINLQMSGILGNVEETLGMMFRKEGGIHIIRISVSNLSSYGGEKSALLTLPYTFATRKQFWEFTRSELAQEVMNEPYEKGTNIKGLFYGEEGFRNFFSVLPINTPADFKGKTVRLPDDPVQKKLVSDMGATPIQIGFDALYVSMQTGLADIAEQPTANFLANSFYSVAPNLILDGHALGAVEAIMSAEMWDSLTKDQQNILIEAGRYATEYCQQISEQTENQALKTLKDLGVNIVEVNDKTPWLNAAKEVQNQYSAKYPELYQKILNLPK